MTAEPEWVFEKEPRMGGASTGAWLNPLTGSGLTSEEALSRETIQNSCDAVVEGGSIFVRFSRQVLQSDRARRFGSALGVADGPGKRLQVLGLPSGNALEVMGNDAPSELELLYVEDFETVGLGGKLEEGWGPDDRFRRLCLLLGVEDKAEESKARGGSFGYGKSVYASGSDIRTVVFYSVFEPTADTNGATARLFTCSFFGAHEWEGSYYTGRAWFGRKDANGQDCWPLEDEEAHAVAESLGFTRRDSTGTSILIVGSKVSMDRLRAGIETYWWPRMVDKDLSVELLDDGVSVEPPRPMLRRDLAPFIHCYEILNDRAEAHQDQGERYSRFNREGHFELGELALKKSELTTKEDDDSDDANGADFSNTVALVRALRMVVQYRPSGYNYLEPVVGVFLADPDSQAILRLSEPPAHNHWDADNERLDPSGHAVVQAILRRIDRQTRDFQRWLQPLPPPTSGRLVTLENLLARFMKAHGKTRPPSPEHVSDPFHINMRQLRTESDQRASIAAEIKLSLREDAGVDALHATVVIRASVLANDNWTVDERIPVEELRIVEGNGTADSGSGVAQISLSKDAPATLIARSTTFEPDWLASLTVSVEANQDQLATT